MAKRILVPLSGAESAASIVPVVGALGRGAGASVRLLRVFPVPEHVVGPHGRTLVYVDQEMDRLTHVGREDLRAAAAELDEIPVEAVVRFGDPASEIQLEAEAFGADLIALTASRRGRLRAALAPGVAERVIRGGRVPTLVLRP